MARWKFCWNFSILKPRYDKLYEGIKTSEYGRYYRRDFLVSSGTNGLYSEIYLSLIHIFAEKDGEGAAAE